MYDKWWSHVATWQPVATFIFPSSFFYAPARYDKQNNQDNWDTLGWHIIKANTTVPDNWVMAFVLR